MANTTQASLLRRVAEGIDPAAWTEFHRRYAELILGFARRQGLPSADCDDIVQDVLLALLKSMRNFHYDESVGRFRGYLKTVTLRAIGRRRQQAGRLEVREDLEAGLAEAAAGAEIEQQWHDEWRRHHIRRAMARLQPEVSLENRQAFSLYAIQGRSAEATAELLGISVAQVYQAKSRILRRLAELIREQVAAEG